MHFIEVSRFGAVEELVLKEGPSLHPTAGEVVLDTKVAGINFADIMARQGYYPPVPTAPYRPGFEVAGVVREVGEGVTHLQVGDRVVSLAPTGGGYATQVVVPAAMAIPVPADIPLETATALLVQGMTAYFLLAEARLSAGDTVLVTGAAGGVGSMAVKMATLQGAKVIGLASASKHERVRANGAFAVLDYTSPGWAAQVRTLTEEKGVDIFLDAEGNFGGEGYEALARKGRWMIYGIQTPTPSAMSVDKQWDYVFRNATLRGYTVDTDFHRFPEGMAQAFAWVQAGQLAVEVTRYPLADVGQAHADIEARRTTGKVVLVMPEA